MMTTGAVSDHAVVRWLERVEGIDLRPYRALAAARGRAHWGDAGVLEHLAGRLAPGEVRQRILASELLRTALRTGAASVRMGAVRAMIQDGVVATFKPARRAKVEKHGRRRPGGLVREALREMDL